MPRRKRRLVLHGLHAMIGQNYHVWYLGKGSDYLPDPSVEELDIPVDDGTE